MKREISLEEISDGKLYESNDMVKADCQDCRGCFACCCGMGNSVVLDPLDLYRMEAGLGQTVQQLLAGPVELNVADGLILPNLKMAGGREACSFLNEEGRCSIHPFRPGICRMFPLGRIYENGSFRYFLQNHECRNGNRTKVKVRKWLDTPDFGRYEKYIADWHYFLLDLQTVMNGGREQEGSGGTGAETDLDAAKRISMYLLKAFYLVPFDQGRDFYDQFDRRLTTAKAHLLKECQ